MTSHVVRVPYEHRNLLTQVADEPWVEVSVRDARFVRATVFERNLSLLALGLRSEVPVYIGEDLHYAKGARFMLAAGESRRSPKAEQPAPTKTGIRTGYTQSAKPVPVEYRTLGKRKKGPINPPDQ